METLLTQPCDFKQVLAANYVTSLILPGDIPGRAGISSSPKITRYGLNTYGISSPLGGWIITGPSRKLILSIIEKESLNHPVLATADIDDQWLFFGKEHIRGIGSMVQIILGLIPGTLENNKARWREIQNDFVILISQFIKESTEKIVEFSPEKLRWDLDEGDVVVPTTLDQVDDLPWFEIEALDGPQNKVAQDRLKYWWESIFTMWWKGFW